MIIINGKKIAREILRKQKKIIQTERLAPGLATILIGDNEASKIYINEKRKKAQKIGIDFLHYGFAATVPQKKIEDLIDSLNANPAVHGIIVQFPIPANIDADVLVAKIAPHKDADGFHPDNIRRFLAIPALGNILDADLIVPVTPVAIMEILNRTLRENPGIAPQKPSVAIIGKCSIFIEPLVHYFKLQSSDASHSFTVISPDDSNLAQKTRLADILIAAAGSPRMVTEKMVKPGAIVIEVGVSRVEGKIVGDVDFDRVASKTAAITPTIGGLGPVTVAILLRNVVKSCLKMHSLYISKWEVGWG